MSTAQVNNGVPIQPENPIVEQPSALQNLIAKISNWFFSRWALVVVSAALTAACFGAIPGLMAGLVAIVIALVVKSNTPESVPQTPHEEHHAQPGPEVPAQLHQTEPIPGAPGAETQQRQEIPRLSRERRIAIFEETRDALARFDVIQHTNNVLARARAVQPMAALPPPVNPVQTRWLVEPCTTFEMILRLTNQGYRPLVLDMANRYRRGGGVTNGAAAQEETLCCQSDLYAGLERVPYPLPERGGAYIPGVQFFRDDRFRFINPPLIADVFASAAYNCNQEHGRGYDRPANDNEHIDGTKEKIRTMLRTGRQEGHSAVVLSAFGCGAFRNDPQEIARMYREIFQEPEFRGAFEVVAFGIYDPPDTQNPNYPIFRQQLLAT